jgi:hypothetical protein
MYSKSMVSMAATISVLAVVGGVGVMAVFSSHGGAVVPAAYAAGNLRDFCYTFYPAGSTILYQSCIGGSNMADCKRSEQYDVSQGATIVQPCHVVIYKQ